jgi:hypothetical protein
MVFTRRQALLNSAFAFGGTVVNPQFAGASDRCIQTVRPECGHLSLKPR